MINMPGNFHRTWTLAHPPCLVCRGRGVVRALLYPRVSEAPIAVRCPHCGPPYLPISTYHHREQS